MYNNALFGFMIQKSICDKFKINLTLERQINTFSVNTDGRLVDYIDGVIDDVFKNIDLHPVKCTTFELDDDGKEIPYNFVLSDNSTLSIRTNISGFKVAPRKVGQAGFDKLNYYFKDIYGSPIVCQDDIKKLFCEKVDKALPIFFDHLLDADYILWVYQDNNRFSYHLIKGNADVGIKFEREKFSFTRDYNDWIESTTLKYENISIAEIQVHKNRSFKFRFIMKNILPFIINKERNNETLGITAEKTICDMFNLSYPNNFFKRYSVKMQYQLYDTIMYAFHYLPRPISHCGSSVGSRGGVSKSSYDFILYGDKTLSLKTNIGKMVCPPEVGQPNDATCYLYFGHLIDESFIDKNIFKKLVFNHIEKMLPIYVEHMFDSDYLLRIVESTDPYVGLPYDYEIYPKSLGSDFAWERDLISFSKKTLEDWNESNTLYYNGISIGEFQVHSNRNCFKFRFNFKNLMKVLRKK